MKSYAGIGSRNVPKDVLNIMYLVGRFLANKGYILRSGRAKGSDQAFEKGCDERKGKKEIYLPWYGFENSTSELVIKDKRAFEIAEKFHPRWNSLNQGGRKLQARNSHQVLGWDLDSKCAFIVCYTKDGKGSGGTGQSIRTASHYDIPVFDFGLYRDVEQMKEEFNKFYEKYKYDKISSLSRKEKVCYY